MKQLKRIVLVQFYLHEASDIEVDGATAFLGPNGCGKSSTLDALQIAMLGGNQQYLHYNTQSVSSKQGRSLAGYCLGLLRNPDKDSEFIGRARDEARTYIVLVFSDGTDKGTVSAGLCIEADIDSDKAEIMGLFVLPGMSLKASDCIVYDGKDRRPMPFPDFREATRERAKKLNRTPIFTDKSGEYVSELLYALNGQRMPEERRFMASFVKSMTLKNVDSIDKFVREYVIESNPVDIAAFRTQVEQFIKLRTLIVQTKARISRIQGVIVDFEKARAAERRIAALEAINAIFKVEWLGEQIDTLSDRIESVDDTRKEAKEQAGHTKSERDLKQNEVTDLRVQLQSDQTEQVRLRLGQEISSSLKLIAAYQQPEITRGNRLISALRDLVDDEDFSDVHKTMGSALRNLMEARSQQNPGVSFSLMLRQMEAELASIRAEAIKRKSFLEKKREQCDEEREATRRRIRATSTTKRLLGEGAALLLELLANAGMEAQPVSALARITEPEWAPALEAYLGSDRDALVVTEGDTREAVKILREARRNGLRIDGAAIIQPAHLGQVNPAAKSEEFAVGVFECENDTARRFLWQKFGNMRLVETEAELESNSRAISRDGMLSQGGLTKSIRVARMSDLRVGKDVEDTSDLSRHSAQLQGQLEQLGKQLTFVNALVSALSSQDSDDDSATKLIQATLDLEEAKQKLSALNVSHLDEIRLCLHDAQGKCEQLDAEFIQYDRIATKLAEQIISFESEKQKLETQLPAYQEAERTAAANPLAKRELIDEIKEEIERNDPDYEKRLADVDKKLVTYQSRQRNAEESASIELFGYVKDERLDVQVTDMHWHDRFFWAAEEKAKLVNTKLQDYETEAEQARLASEETLRSDIAMSLHDRIREMDHERRERNKILDFCPAFTGGERYRFTSNVVPHYEALIRYIQQIANDENNFSLFADNPDEINQTLRDLVEAAADSGNAESVLDYRQFFTFDLDIFVDGKRVDKMSNRQGAGSNGEHIAPMYVAAGAALAKAYRLHDRKGQQSGTGLICLDEAFHGMDTMNAIATARFLQSIGLQLIMAAPDTERTKLVPITQTLYDLDREGLDLLMERTTFKPAANALMVSDTPDGNSQIVMDAYDQLGLDRPPDVVAVEQETIGE